MDELIARSLLSADPAEVLNSARELSLRRDRRAVIPLMNLLSNRAEKPCIRGEAAECLARLNAPRAIKALIRGSRDPSPEVRFWCVFALGHFAATGRKRLPRAGVRALEARLEDRDSPESNGFWPIRWEALAMLASTSERAHDRFRRELHRVLDDPLGNRELWGWASFYAEADDLTGEITKITAAGLEPTTFGRTPAKPN